MISNFEVLGTFLFFFGYVYILLLITTAIIISGTIIVIWVGNAHKVKRSRSKKEPNNKNNHLYRLYRAQDHAYGGHQGPYFAWRGPFSSHFKVNAGIWLLFTPAPFYLVSISHTHNYWQCTRKTEVWISIVQLNLVYCILLFQSCILLHIQGPGLDPQSGKPPRIKRVHFATN